MVFGGFSSFQIHLLSKWLILKVHMNVYTLTCANLPSSFMGLFPSDSYSSRHTEEVFPGACRVCCLRAGNGVPDGNSTVNLSAPDSSTPFKKKKKVHAFL